MKHKNQNTLTNRLVKIAANNMVVLSFFLSITWYNYQFVKDLKVEIRSETAQFKDYMAKSDAKWEATNARIDNTYSLILEEIRSRKQEGK